MSLRVREGRDCATRIRRVYTLGRPLTIDDATFLVGAEVEVLAFSSFVATARDHVRVRLGGSVEASYAVGDTELTIAYGKLGASAPTTLIAAVESRLVAFFEPTDATAAAS